MESIKNSIGMEFILIPSGSFIMGALDSDAIAEDDEKPPHKVNISKSFYLGKFVVTQGEYQKIMGKNPSENKKEGLSAPVECVSWEDAQEFIRKLNLTEKKISPKIYRLPTEAEWEYACRAGTTTVYSFGNELSKLVEYGWYDENSNEQSHPVGKKLPNPWGLYDMHGNVWEWCSDWYGEDYYSEKEVTDPQGPSKGSRKVLRGGGWSYHDKLLRSSNRLYRTINSKYDSIGFRVVLNT